MGGSLLLWDVQGSGFVRYKACRGRVGRFTEVGVKQWIDCRGSHAINGMFERKLLREGYGFIWEHIKLIVRRTLLPA